MHEAIDYATRIGRCLRPALSSLRDGARKTVSALRASIAIAWACDIASPSARGLIRSATLALPMAFAMAIAAGSFPGWVIFTYAATGIMGTIIFVRAAEFWKARAFEALRQAEALIDELAEGDADD